MHNSNHCWSCTTYSDVVFPWKVFLHKNNKLQACKSTRSKSSPVIIEIIRSICSSSNKNGIQNAIIWHCFLRILVILVLLFGMIFPTSPRKVLGMIFNNPHHCIPSTTRETVCNQADTSHSRGDDDASDMVETFPRFDSDSRQPNWPSSTTITRASLPPTEHIRIITTLHYTNS